MKLRVECAGLSGSYAISAMEFAFSRQAPSSATATIFTGLDHSAVPIDQHAEPNGPNTVRVGTIALELDQFLARTGTLANTVYIGPFRNALNEGASQYYDLAVGTAFVHTWDQ